VEASGGCSRIRISRFVRASLTTACPRSFRLHWPPGVILFEIDRDDVFTWKEAVLAGQGAKPACERRVIRADLTDNWVQSLLAAGFDSGRPAAFVAEGLVMYLQPEAVLDLMASVTSIAADGSWIAIDAANPELAASRAKMGQRILALGAEFRSAMADPRLLFAEHGWHAEVVSPGHARADYGRWPYPPTPAGVRGVPRAYFVTASRGPAFAPPVPLPVSATSAEPHFQEANCVGWRLLDQDLLGIVEKQMPAGATTSWCRHDRLRQFFYVLNGQLSIDVEQVVRVVDMGSGLEIPPLVTYRVRNSGGWPASFLTIELRFSSMERKEVLPAPAT
jgi:mannose-6-phosphate isomerase-like protein (cupin superfamily)